MKFGTDIYKAQRMNPNDFGDPVTCFSSATVRLKFVVLSEMSKQLLDGLAWNSVRTMATTNDNFHCRLIC